MKISTRDRGPDRPKALQSEASLADDCTGRSLVAKRFTGSWLAAVARDRRVFSRQRDKGK